jgi:phenylacetate-coenzyme A ligase PaaK-like adenylate-forming protein
MLITETLDWRDIVNQLPMGASKTLASCCNVKSFNKTSKLLTLKISVDNANANANSSVEELQQAIREITGVNKISVTIKVVESGEIVGKRKHTLLGV